VAKLIYSAIASLDGYVAEEDGNFDWAVPDEEVHSFINNLAGNPDFLYPTLLANSERATFILGVG